MLKQFFTKLQHADEPTRKKWAIILSGATMAIMVGLWVLYINVMVPTVPRATPETEIARKPEPRQANFLDILGAGFSRIIAQLKTTLASKHKIVIQNPAVNFVVEDLEEIPKTKLP